VGDGAAKYLGINKSSTEGIKVEKSAKAVHTILR
jgi:hypothetical protein